MIRIALVVGSTRPGRRGTTVARWILGTAADRRGHRGLDVRCERGAAQCAPFGTSPRGSTTTSKETARCVIHRGRVTGTTVIRWSRPLKSLGLQV